MTSNPESGTITLDELLLIQAAVEKVRCERDELRADNERLHALRLKEHEQYDAWRIRRDQLQAENERLRAEVDMWHRHYAGLLNEAHDENERLRARLDAAERLIEVVRAREIGTAGGVGAAFESYDALGHAKEC